MNWGRGLKRVYIVAWVLGAGLGGLVVVADTISTISDWRTLHSYVARHKVTLIGLQSVGDVDSYLYGSTIMSRDQREFYRAAQIAQSDAGRKLGSHLAIEWGWFVLLGGLLPAVVLRTLAWIAAGFKATRL